MIKNFLSHWSQIYQDKRWLTLSNILTLMRLAVIPVLVIVMYQQEWEWAFGLFLLAAGTDILDGQVARWLHEQTNLGRVLDPLVDKILVVSVFCVLAAGTSPVFVIPQWFVWLVVVREVIMIVGSCIIMYLCCDVVVDAMIWGKLTMLFQVLFISWLFVCYFFNWLPEKTYCVLLIMLALFSVLSLLHYIKRGIMLVGDRMSR
jgi:cardiolipin synthase